MECNLQFIFQGIINIYVSFMNMNRYIAAIGQIDRSRKQTLKTEVTLYINRKHLKMKPSLFEREMS